MRLVIVFAVVSLLISSCSWMPFVDSDKKSAEEEEARAEELEGLNEKQFYDRIQRNLDAHNWSDAISNLQSFEAQFPFGNYAEQAQLELIYAYMESNDYEAATAAAERFIRLHPRHPNVDYAYYMKGLAAASQHKGIFTDIMPTDMTRRDPGEARRAFAAFGELLSQYPDSSYAADARKRMLFLRNMLARHEIHAANYYFKRGAYLAAANRGRYVVENFDETPAVPDGLAVMAQAYHLMGLQELANHAEQVLAANYSNYPDLNDQGQLSFLESDSVDKKSWLNRLSFGYFKPKNPPYFDSRAIYNPVYKTLTEPKADDADTLPPTSTPG